LNIDIDTAPVADIAVNTSRARVDRGSGVMASPQERNKIRNMLIRAGLRATNRRIALGSILFGGASRHITAAGLYEEARRANIKLTAATVYNTLHEFARAKLLSKVVVEGSGVYFDTNVSKHNHFFIPSERVLIDIAGPDLQKCPAPPAGYQIERVEIIVRLVRSAGASATRSALEAKGRASRERVRNCSEFDQESQP
jgi:Fur family iron response transcriptional regulator